jgi:hypothetical protein
MKTFGEVKVGDLIYTINDDFRIKSAQVCGVEDFQLMHKKAIIKTLNFTIPVDFDKSKYVSNEVSLYSCLQAAQEAREIAKTAYADKQWRIAMQAFRRLKRAVKDTEKQKRIIFQFFQMLEEDYQKELNRDRMVNEANKKEAINENK